jgi:hypothetical protein
VGTGKDGTEVLHLSHAQDYRHNNGKHESVKLVMFLGVKKLCMAHHRADKRHHQNPSPHSPYPAAAFSCII